MDLPEVHAFLKAHYETVSVDVGRFDKNLQIPARFGITDRLEGVPSVLVATPGGKLVNPGHNRRACRRPPHDPAIAGRLAGAMDAVTRYVRTTAPKPGTLSTIGSQWAK